MKKGTQHTLEAREQMKASALRVGTGKWNKGRSTRGRRPGFRHSGETRHKISIAHTGMKGTPISPARREQIRQFNLGTKRSAEQKKNMSEAAKRRFSVKENHPSWLSDRSLVKLQEPRSGAAYTEWKMAIYARDNSTCRIANNDCSGSIEAHHILGWKDHPELRYDANNGITLCVFHHPRKRVEEEQLSSYFQYLVLKTI